MDDDELELICNMIDMLVAFAADTIARREVTLTAEGRDLIDRWAAYRRNQ
jgi:hypothetical protein